MAYVDESYDKDFYFIGAAVGTQEQWDRVEAAFDAIRNIAAELHGTPSDAELHGHELMGGKGPWRSLRGKHREAAGIYLTALRAARSVGIRYLFRGVDVGRLNARYSYPDPPHDVTLGHLLERIEDYTIGRKQTEQTIVVADEIATQTEHQRAFAGYQRFGTAGYRSSRLNWISAPINFASSKGSDGLQAVDLATYVYFRSQRIRSPHPKAQATQERLWNEVAPVTSHRHTWLP
ncbi:hypothetical protein DEJ25_13270 [Curtobacterium sp. MCPF17_011]|nr:hypothetical protein DEJ25_13270 [Curtobacterium sp. MCPF17_011]